MTTLQSDILVLNSKNKSSGTNQSATYNLVSMGGIGSAPLSRYEMISFHSQNQMYNVELNVNDQVHFEILLATPLVATLTPGNYTASTLLTEVLAQMAAASGSAWSASSYSSETGKYTFIRDAAATFRFLWATTTRSARRLLGFDEVDGGVLQNTYVSDNPIDLVLHNNIMIRIPEEGRKDVTILNGTDYSLLIPLNSAFGEHIHHRKEQHYQQLIEFTSNVATVDVDLYTGDGVALVNSPDYELVLRKLV